MRTFSEPGAARKVRSAGCLSVEFFQLVLEAGEGDRGSCGPVPICVVIYLISVYSDLGDLIQKKTCLFGQWLKLRRVCYFIPFRWFEASQLQRRFAQHRENA